MSKGKAWLAMALAKLVIVLVAVIALETLGWELWYVAVALAVWLPLEVALEYRLHRRTAALERLGWAVMDVRNDSRKQLRYLFDRLRPFAEELIAAGYNPYQPASKQPREIQSKHHEFEALVRMARIFNKDVPRCPLEFVERGALYEIPPPPKVRSGRSLFAVM